ncbi:hypothetical protein BGZ98_009503 [Dissophora globulifera]|nr:hypothetical protein BGZ98_009503 [Dissophora globulifera]
MQRDEEKLDMPGGFKTSRSVSSNMTNSTDNLYGDVSSAEPMRASNINNPLGSSYEVAGPTVGGSPIPYDRGNVAMSKDQDHNTLVDTVKVGAAAAATGAAAAGASVIAAAKRMVHHGEDVNDVNGPPNVAHHPQIDNTRQSMNKSERIPIAQPPTDINQHPIQTTTNEMSHSYGMHPKTVTAATAGTTAATGIMAASAMDLKPKESTFRRLEGEVTHLIHHGIPKDNSHQYAMTSARTLLAQQEFASRNAALRAGHNDLAEIRHNKAAITTSSAPPEISADTRDYVPKDYSERFPELSREDAIGHHSAGATAAMVGAPLATAVGTAAYLDSSNKGALPREQGVADMVSPSTAVRHTGYLPSDASVASTYQGQAPRNVTTPAETVGPTFDTRYMDSQRSAGPTFDTRYLENQRGTGHTSVTPIAAATAATAGAAATATGLNASLRSKGDEQIIHTPSHVISTDNATIGANNRGSVYPAEATRSLEFTDPKSLKPVTEIRPIAVHASEPQTHGLTDTVHMPTEYGPADPKALHTVDPKTIGYSRTAIAGAAVAGAAGTAGAKSAHGTGVVAPRVLSSSSSMPGASTTMKTPSAAATAIPTVTGVTTPTSSLFFTDAKTLRPVTGPRRTIPVVAQPLKLSTPVPHMASEYGPADIRALKLTDPRTLGRGGKTMAAETATALNAKEAVKPHVATTDATTPSVNATSDAHSSNKPLAAAGAVGAATGATALHAHNNTSRNTATALSPTTNADLKGHSVGDRIEAATADTATPSSYTGPVPSVGTGEEVIWMKTTTTSTVLADGRTGEIIEQKQTILAPHELDEAFNNSTMNSYNDHNDFRDTAHGTSDGTSHQQHQQKAQRQAHQHRSGFLSRLLGRTSSTDKGKSRM